MSIVPDSKPEHVVLGTPFAASSTTSCEELPSTETREADTKLLRHLDRRVLPPLCVIFLLSFLDRSNIGNAKIQGLEASLGMKGEEYSISLLVFFTTYILFEVPSNLMLKKLGPPKWMSLVVVGWGCCTIGQGLVKNLGGLSALRVVLGMFESGVTPGGIYIISTYYPRRHLQLRISLFFASVIIAGAFGGLFAFALAKLDGIAWLEGWRWIFVIEGLLTALFGVTMRWWLVDWPDRTTFLSTEEKARLFRIMAADAGGDAVARMDRLDKRAIKRIVLDWKIWMGIVLHNLVATSTYGVAFFLPAVIKDMGYTSAEAQLRVIPVYTVAACVSLTCAVLVDRYHARYAFIMVTLAPGITGFSMQLAGPSLPLGARYFSCFLTAISAFGTLPIVIAWVTTQIGGQYKRAIGTAMIIGFGNLGGIVGSNIWLNREAPRYTTGVSVSLAFLVSCAVLSTLYFFILRAENRRRDAGERDYRLQHEDLKNMGDDHPSWRFAF